MSKRRIALIASVSAGVCLLAAAASLFLLPALLPQPDLAPQIARIDAAIAGGNLFTATAELLAVSPVPRGPQEALRVLKRAFTLSREAGDFRLLALVSDRVMAYQSRDPALRLVAAYSYLRTGRLADAEAMARRGLAGDSAGLVRGETILRRGGEWLGSDSTTRRLLGLDSSRQAADFIAAGKLVEDARLGLDAALLSLENGDREGARTVAAASLSDPRFDEPAALIAYDAGDFETALRRLHRLLSREGQRADISVLLADCYYALGRKAESLAALHRAMALDPKVSWTVYANLAREAEQSGDLTRALEILGAGRSLFPGSREILLDTARLEEVEGDPTSAQTVLRALVAQRPDDTEAALVLLGLQAPAMAPQAYRAEMWKLFDRAPSDQRVFLTLVSSLIALHDWESMRIAVQQHEMARGTDDPDTLAVQAAVLAMQGKEAQATDSFALAAEKGGDLRYRYDQAVLLFRRGDPQGALTRLGHTGGEVPADVQARIETLKGRCMLATGDVSGARSAFLRASTADPHALGPAMELRKLEAQGHQ